MICAWLTKPPELYLLHKRVKIALSDIVFQDIDGSIWISKRGYPSDGASIPFFLDCIWDPFDLRIIRSVLQHDIQYTLHDFDATFTQTRQQVDGRFLRSLICEGWKSANLWNFFVRLFAQYLWIKMTKNPDSLDWYQAVKQGEEALDEWIKKCMENPRRLQSVRYYNQIQNDKLKTFIHICDDLRGFYLWCSSGGKD